MLRSRLVTALVAVWCTAGVVAGQEPAGDELRKLEGGWVVVAAEQRGKPFDVIRGGGLVIEGTTFALKTAAGNEFKGHVRVDAGKSPKQLDFVHDKDGVVWEAIYTVTDETLRLIYVDTGDGDRRPSIFATSADSPGTIIVMNRMTRR